MASRSSSKQTMAAEVNESMGYPSLQSSWALRHLVTLWAWSVLFIWGKRLVIYALSLRETRFSSSEVLSSLSNSDSSKRPLVSFQMARLFPSEFELVHFCSDAIPTRIKRMGCWIVSSSSGYGVEDMLVSRVS